MQTADGGGGSGGGRWSGYDVRALWGMLANQETNNHWTHVTGWRKAHELTSLHLSRLKRYRESLATAWPPEKSAAARAYVERLDFLITTVQGTYDAAVANHETFRAATLAIGDSRRDLKVIYDEYVAKESLKQQHDLRLAANPAARNTDIPPVTNHDLDVLKARARSIMSGLSGELATAQVRIQQPPAYKPQGGIKPEDPGASGGSGASGAPPVIPPIVPIPAGGQSSTGAQPTPITLQPVTAPTAPGAGPVLGSSGPIAPTPPVNVPSPSVISPTPAPPPGPGGFPGPLAPGVVASPKLPGVFGPTTPGLAPGLGNGAGAPPRPGPITGVPRAMPPGGMIGGMPGAGAGQPVAGSAAARRINPVGGLIGGSPTGTPIGSTGARHTSGMGMSPSTGRKRTNDESVRLWDPDNPWEVDEGVSPIVLPAKETGRIDPGPAIGTYR